MCVAGAAIAVLVLAGGTAMRQWLTQPWLALLLPAAALLTYPSAAKMRPSYRDTGACACGVHLCGCNMFCVDVGIE